MRVTFILPRAGWPRARLLRVQLFLTLNDLAGRFPLLDAFMRGVYLATIPLLALILLGLLILAPRARHAPSRGKVALATVVALGGAALLMWGIDSWAQSLSVGTLSPRPFMTRWVNLLIVEPQDNSFPCVEVIVATILSVGIWAAHRRWGVFAALATLLLMTARLFCGSNYLADVGVAALAGVGIMLLALALCRAPRTRNWRAGLAGMGAFTLGGTALATFLVMASMPRFAGKMQLPWGAAAPAPTVIMEGAPTAARGELQEGEGMPTLGMNSDGSIKADEYAGAAEALALSKRATLFLPQAEAALTKALAPLAAPFRLVDVEVAPVNFNDGSYRVAAVRFEIDPKTPDARQLVAARAATLVKAAFAADKRLDNVDITGVVTGGAQKSDSLMRFAGDEVPVFTASIQRRNLTVNAPKWANAPGLEGGLWLRTRSRLWIDDEVLPRTPEIPPTPATPKTPKFPATPATSQTPKTSPTPATSGAEIAATSATMAPQPTSAPQPTVRAPASPKPTVKPRVSTKPTAKPTVKPRGSKPRVGTKPKSRPTVKPTPAPLPRVRPKRETV